jgi:hypothetical protein
MPGRNQIISSLPNPVGNSIVLEESQSVTDIMSAMIYMHKKNAPYYDKISLKFLGATILDTCENLFDFCKQNIPNETETEDLQTVKSPQRILSDASAGYGHDCKHFASFIGGVLDSLRRKGKNISWCYRFASYKIFDTTPGHVFVVVKNRGQEIWVDPVLDYLDQRKSYSYSIDKNIQSSIGCCCDNGGLGKIGADNATAATLKTIGGTICAVAPTVAACIPIGTVVAALAEVAGFALTFIGGLFQSKYAYSSQVDWLCVYYQRLVLGDANAKGDHITTGLKEEYVPAAQMWFAAVGGVPMWDMLRYHALAGTDPNSDAKLNNTVAQRAAAYQAFGSIEAAVPYAAVLNAVNIFSAMNDQPGVGGWANMPPANIVLQQEGLTAEQAVQQAAPVLTGSNPNAMPTTTIFASLDGPYVIPFLIGGAVLLLMATNQK